MSEPRSKDPRERRSCSERTNWRLVLAIGLVFFGSRAFAVRAQTPEVGQLPLSLALPACASSADWTILVRASLAGSSTVLLGRCLADESIGEAQLQLLLADPAPGGDSAIADPDAPFAVLAITADSGSTLTCRMLDEGTLAVLRSPGSPREMTSAVALQRDATGHTRVLETWTGHGSGAWLVDGLRPVIVASLGRVPESDLSAALRWYDWAGRGREGEGVRRALMDAVRERDRISTITAIEGAIGAGRLDAAEADIALLASMPGGRAEARRLSRELRATRDQAAERAAAASAADAAAADRQRAAVLVALYEGTWTCAGLGFEFQLGRGGRAGFRVDEYDALLSARYDAAAVDTGIRVDVLTDSPRIAYRFTAVRAGTRAGTAGTGGRALPTLDVVVDRGRGHTVRETCFRFPAD
jgi:hypothetical protein